MESEDVHQNEEMPQEEEKNENVQEQENNAVQKDESLSPFAQSITDLASMGYHVFKSKDDGFLRFRQIEGNKEFEFKTQKHYDKLGDFLCDWIQGYMQEEQKMKKVMIPHKEELQEGYAQAPIFISEDWETNKNRALVLIQGTGDVRSGFWARSVCMNDTIDLGSMIPDIDFARKNGFSVLVMNPNYSYTPDKIKVSPQIRGMSHHSNYCWENFVEQDVCPAKEIFIVAHSAGGG